MGSFDFDALRRGIDHHETDVVIDLYTEDAVLEIVDASNPPSRPRRIEGREALRAYFDDVFSRDMVHEVQRAFGDDEHVAFSVACRYASGEQVLTSESCDLEDGRIARETLVQAWDG